MPAPPLLARVDPVMSGRTPAVPMDALEAGDLAFEARALPDDGRHEPRAASAAARIDAAEAARLDPARAQFIPDLEAAERRVLGGPIGSLLLHLLPLLALITWLRPPLEIPPPIPIQLVIEQPPPPPPPPPAPPKPKAEPKPPPGLRSSEDMGAVGPPKPEKGPDTEPPTQGAPQPPAPDTTPQTKPADTAPEPPQQAKPADTTPEPSPAPTQVAALPPPPPAPPKPAPPKKEAAVRLPKPDGLTFPLPIHPDQPRLASRSGKVPGPNATRDEYCAYALQLTLQHINLLPLSFVGARHGDTAVGIVLRPDGSITSVRVINGSNYEDIDEKVVQMVWAVGRFPPLPAWVPGSQAEFTFHLHFPNPVER